MAKKAKAFYLHGCLRQQKTNVPFCGNMAPRSVVLLARGSFKGPSPGSILNISFQASHPGGPCEACGVLSSSQIWELQRAAGSEVGASHID